MILKAPMIETLIDKIKKIVSKSLIKINKRYKINNFSILKNKFLIEKTKNIQFGNLSTNIAMIAKINGKTQMEISKLIKKYINHKSKYFTKIEIKKPGFINFFLNERIIEKCLNEINKKKCSYGQFKHKRIYYNIESFSTSLTGSILISYRSNGIYGDCLARI